MPSNTTHHGLRVELCVRSLAPAGAHGNQNAVIERLERLEAAGVVEAFDIRIWGKQVAPSTAAARTETGRAALDRYEQFKEWAEHNDRSLGSFFDVHPVELGMTGEQYTAVMFPVVTMAEYRDGDLVHVAPCTDGDTVYTVGDRLDTIEGDAAPVEAGEGENEESEIGTGATMTVDNGN